MDSYTDYACVRDLEVEGRLQLDDESVAECVCRMGSADFRPGWEPDLRVRLRQAAIEGETARLYRRGLSPSLVEARALPSSAQAAYRSPPPAGEGSFTPLRLLSPRRLRL